MTRRLFRNCRTRTSAEQLQISLPFACAGRALGKVMIGGWRNRIDLPSNRRAAGEFAFHDDIRPLTASHQLGTGIGCSGIDEVDPPCVPWGIEGPDGCGVSIVRYRIVSVCTSRKDKQVLDRSAFQYPGCVQLSLAVPSLTARVIQNSIQLPLSDKKTKKVRLVRDCEIAMRRKQGLDEMGRNRHGILLSVLRCAKVGVNPVL